MWVKDGLTEYNKLRYTVSHKMVHPDTDVYPIFKVWKTVYVPMGTEMSPAELDALYEAQISGSSEDADVIAGAAAAKVQNAPIVYQAQNVVEQKPLVINDMHFDLDVTDRSAEGLDNIYHWYYNGYMSYREYGDDIEKHTDPETTLLTPAYYDVEAFIEREGDKPYVVLDNVYSPGGIDNYLNWSGYHNVSNQLIVNTGDNLGSDVVGGFNQHFRIGSFYSTDRVYPILVITPVYIYKRNPELEARTGIEINDLIEVRDAAAASARRRVGGNNLDEEKVAPDMEYVVVRGGAGIYRVKSSNIDQEGTTGVDALENAIVTVSTGVGYITILGGNDNVDVYNVSGVKVAQGSGTHYLSPGVYIVRIGAKAASYIVR